MQYIENGLNHVFSKIFGFSNNSESYSSDQEVDVNKRGGEVATTGESKSGENRERQTSDDVTDVKDGQQIEIDVGIVEDRSERDHDTNSPTSLHHPRSTADDIVVDMGNPVSCVLPGGEEDLSHVTVAVKTTTSARKQRKHDLSKISTKDLMKNIESFSDQDFKRIFGQQDEDEIDDCCDYDLPGNLEEVQVDNGTLNRHRQCSRNYGKHPFFSNRDQYTNNGQEFDNLEERKIFNDTIYRAPELTQVDCQVLGAQYGPDKGTSHSEGHILETGCLPKDQDQDSYPVCVSRSIFDNLSLDD